MNPLVAACLWLYRRLARAFPHEFQMVYGADIVQLGEDAAEEIWRRYGLSGMIRLLADLAVRVPAEHLSEISQDLLYAMRILFQSPGFALVGIVSLALSMGMTTVWLAGINSLILRDLPAARDPHRLQILQAPASYAYFERYRDRVDLFAGASAFISTIFNVALEGEKAARVSGHLVSPEYFSVLGIQAAQGRVLSPELDKAGEAPVVVISDRFWRTRLDSDPRAVGRSLRVNGQLATIVGIGPADFFGVIPYPTRADLFVPVTLGARFAPELGDNVLERRDLPAFRVLLRLAPGVTTPFAEVALETITRQLDRETFSDQPDYKGPRVRLLRGGGIIPTTPENVRTTLAFGGTLMGLVLTIACMNLANMQLARASSRRKEIAIRLAVGASRFRLVRQMLTESVLLAVCGGLAGVMFAFWIVHVLGTIKLPTPDQIEWNQVFHLDWHIVLFSFAASVVAGLGFGLAPAMEGTKTDVAPALKEGASTNLRCYRRFGLRNILVVYQVAGALMLLLITGFLVIGYSRSASVSVGTDDSSLYLLSLDPARDGYSAQQAATFFEKLPERLQALGVARGVALAAAPPLVFNITVTGSAKFTAPAASGGVERVLARATNPAIGAGYFATVGIPILRGREISERDQRVDPGKGGTLSAVLSESASRELFGDDDPLGRRIFYDTQSYEVIGLVPDVKSVMSPGTISAVYVPLTRRSFSHPPPFGLTLIVRGGAGSDALERLRRALAELDPNLTIFNVRTLREELDQADAFLHFGVVQYGSTGLFGLVLAAVGLAGVTAYSVARRRKEIGIRMALGARKDQVLRLVMREGTGLVAVGSVLGFGGAFGLSRALSSFTSQMATALQTGTNDPMLLAGAPMLLAGLAMLACYLPARKSTQIDPLVALREE